MSHVFKNFPINQVIKFIATGGINTGIDFLIFNILMIASGIYSGVWLLSFSAFAFSVATVNSFFLNRYWTFKNETKNVQKKEKEKKDFLQFLSVSIGGLIINASLTVFLSTYIPVFFGIDFLTEITQNLTYELLPQLTSQGIWANLSKVIATCFSLLWNFIGYKFWVFKK